MTKRCIKLQSSINTHLVRRQADPGICNQLQEVPHNALYIFTNFRREDITTVKFIVPYCHVFVQFFKFFASFFGLLVSVGCGAVPPL